VKNPPGITLKTNKKLRYYTVLREKNPIGYVYRDRWFGTVWFAEPISGRGETFKTRTEAVNYVSEAVL
jgi:hypothetical protein